MYIGTSDGVEPPVVWWLPISVVGLTVYAGIYDAYYTHRHHISQVHHLQWCFSLCSWFASFTVRRQNHTTDATNPQVIHCWEHSRITLMDNVPTVKNHRTKRASITSNYMYHLAPMKYHVSQTYDLNQGIWLVAYSRVTVRVNAILSSPSMLVATHSYVAVSVIRNCSMVKEPPSISVTYWKKWPPKCDNCQPNFPGHLSRHYWFLNSDSVLVH